MREPESPVALTSKLRVEALREYYRRLDAGLDVFDLFTEDFEFYFPKFGIGRGRRDFELLLKGLLGSLRTLAHDLEALRFSEGTSGVTVEGKTRGLTARGVSWQGGASPGGRFASVFEFDGHLISRMHIYLDPDYGGADRDRFLWGTVGRRW